MQLSTGWDMRHKCVVRNCMTLPVPSWTQVLALRRAILNVRGRETRGQDNSEVWKRERPETLRPEADLTSYRTPISGKIYCLLLSLFLQQLSNMQAWAGPGVCTQSGAATHPYDWPVLNSRCHANINIHFLLLILACCSVLWMADRSAVTLCSSWSRCSCA